MKILLCLLFLMCASLACGNEIAVEGRLLVKNPPFLDGEAIKDYAEQPIGMVVMALVSNQGRVAIRLPTDGGLIRVVVAEKKRTIETVWDLKKSWNNRPLVQPIVKLSMVELRPGESALIAVETTVAARDVRTVTAFRFVITPEFGARYETTAGRWEGALILPNWGAAK